MNKFKTTDQGGLPFVLDDNRWQDDGYRQAFKGIMSAYGVTDNQAVILSGCERTITASTITISEGYISIAGEICFVPTHSYPNAGLSNLEYWVIDVSYNNDGVKTFQNGDTNDTYEVRIGKISTANSVPTGFTRYQDTPTIFDIINQKIDSIPLGVIMMWSGSVSSIPEGYSICDGSNGTPDLRGRFVIGHDDRTTDPNNDIWDADYNSIGNTGGAKDHTLNILEMPPHQHEVLIASSDSGPGSPDAIIIPSATQGHNDFDPPAAQGVVSLKGGNEPHNNIPPYYVLAFIMKVSNNTFGNGSSGGGSSSSSGSSQSG